jgi:hypothetical protein
LQGKTELKRKFKATQAIPWTFGNAGLVYLPIKNIAGKN